jgi:hypothetical protein
MLSGRGLDEANPILDTNLSLNEIAQELQLFNNLFL